MSDSLGLPRSQFMSKPDRGKLFATASAQGGYFTAGQARAGGFSSSLLSHHVKSGRFIRLKRGLYRFREYPSSPREHVMAAWLAVGRGFAVVSHESALDILGLSEVIPNAVHLTIPRSKRSLSPTSDAKVHTSSRPMRSRDVVTRDGMAVTSAARSILDAAEAGTAPEQIEMAVAQALGRGLSTANQLRRDTNARSRRVARLIAGSLRKANQ